MISLVTWNPILAASLGAGFYVERKVSRSNAEKTGYHTGLVGSIRDSLGLTKKVVSPYDMISEDYDLGIWRGKDFEDPESSGADD